MLESCARAGCNMVVVLERLQDIAIQVAANETAVGMISSAVDTLLKGGDHPTADSGFLRFEGYAPR